MSVPDARSLTHVVLAAPYGQWMDHDLGAMRPGRVAYLDQLRRALLDAGFAVFNAHHNEDWGRAWLPAQVCTPADFAAVERCDVMVAILGQPPSPGVLVELGWASALRKPIVLIADGDVPHLVDGMATVAPLIRVRGVGDDGWSCAAIEAVLKAVHDVRAASHRCNELSGYPRTALPLGYEVSGPGGELGKGQPGQVAQDVVLVGEPAVAQ